MGSQHSAAKRYEAGRASRKDVPRSSHSDWQPPADRQDPVDILRAGESALIPELVPTRYARMAESALAYFRGAAGVMAADLAGTPVMGEQVQAVGDAHLVNFGTFASLERTLSFDINEFDETLPGPWEWDVKRLATSFVLAARDNGFRDKDGRACAEEATSSYRTAMARFASSPVLDVWYAQLDTESLRSAVPTKAERKEFEKKVVKASGEGSRRALGRLVEDDDGRVRIRHDPGLLTPLRHLAGVGLAADSARAVVEENYTLYLSDIDPARRRILEQFRVADIALRSVGIASVGARCWLVLLEGYDHREPFILQVREATPSVLEAYLPRSIYAESGRRVVEGARMIQLTGDAFLGWSGHAESGGSYYWRQFRDMKASANVGALTPERMTNYATICGWTLAHAHARSGDSIMMHGYMGRSRTFEKAVGDFAVAYADQNDKDYASFLEAIRDGLIQAGEA